MRLNLRLISVRSVSMLAAVTAVTLVFVSQANAQRGFGRGGAQLMSGLLSIEEVQKELELTEEQLEEVVAPAAQLNDEFRAEVRSIMQGGGDPSEIADLAKEMREEEAEFIAKLNDDQRARLKQLFYQRLGTGVFMDEGAQKELELTDEQKEKIAEANTTMREAMMDLRQSEDREAAMEKMQSLQEDLQKTLDSILTEAQTAKLAEMKGEAFEFPQRQRGGQRSDF